MNFTEKLIKLRKENGLSQEELGERLDVTRQTVSKWELGQTKPDLDKLVEMSKIFGVSLDELTNENNSKENNNYNDYGETKKINTKWFVLIIVIILIVGMIYAFPYILGTRIINKIFGLTSSSQGTVLNLFNDIKENVFDGVAASAFNSNFEFYTGTKSGSSVKRLIDEVVTNNKKNKDSLITLKYKEIITDVPAEMQALKKEFADLKEYEVSFEYNEAGYIYEVEIIAEEKEDVKEESEDIPTQSSPENNKIDINDIKEMQNQVMEQITSNQSQMTDSQKELLEQGKQMQQQLLEKYGL